MIGDYLYQLTARDQQITPIQPLHLSRSIGAPGSGLLIDYVPPKPFVAVIGHIHLEANAPETEPLVRLNSLQLFVVPALPGIAVPIARLYRYYRPLDGGDIQRQQVDLIYPVPLIIDPRHHRLTADMDTTLTATDSNELWLTLVGKLIPVGNLSPQALA